jgi:hypothetical protein
MSLCAIIPANLMQSANDALEQQGYGGGNFSVPLYANGGATYGGLHAWNDAPFVAAIKAIAGVAWKESEGAPTTRFNALVEAQGVAWGANAPEYPTTGTILPNEIYRYTDGNLYQVIQQYNVVTFPLPPTAYPALIIMAREPHKLYEWYQTGQFDAFKVLNPFTNQNDECMFNGNKYYVTTGDGAGNNTYAPDVYGWSLTDPTPLQTFTQWFADTFL